MEALREQKWIVFHWYDEKLKYVRSSAIHWSEEQRVETTRMVEAVRQIINRTGGGNFDSANYRG